MKRLVIIAAGLLLAGCSGKQDTITATKLKLEKADGSSVVLTAEDVEKIKGSLAAMETLTQMAAEGKKQMEAQKKAATLTDCKSNLKNLATACEMYASDYGGRYPTDVEKLSAGHYLRQIPTCPTGTAYTYTSEASPDTFHFTCTGNHLDNGVRPGFPQYSAEQGLMDN